MSSKWGEKATDGAALQERLRHVYWLGGGSGAGKSAVARRLAARHGLRVYATDDVMADHARRSSRGDCPLLHSFMAMSMDERWVNRPPETMLETFHWFQGEGFNLIIEDLLSLPRESFVIAEGFRLLPRLVGPLLAAPDRAIWLLPTPDFRWAVFEGRGGVGVPRQDRRPGEGLAQSTRTRPDVHEQSPRGDGAPGAARHRGRHHDD